MKRGIVLCLLSVLALSYAGAQGTTAGMAKDAKAPSAVTLKGYVVDQSCGKGIAKKDNPMQKAASHSRDCALEEACSASGYGIFSEGKWYVFDKGGNTMAKSSLEKDKREKALAYEASGTLDGNTLTVSSLKPTRLEASKVKPAQKPVEMK